MIGIVALPSIIGNGMPHGGLIMGAGVYGRRRPTLEELDADTDGRFAGDLEASDEDLDEMFNDALGG